MTVEATAALAAEFTHAGGIHSAAGGHSREEVLIEPVNDAFHIREVLWRDLGPRRSGTLVFPGPDGLIKLVNRGQFSRALFNK